DKSKINNALRYTDWTTGPQYPRLLDSSDLEKINNTFCFFARKINDSIDCQEFSSFKKLVLK
ncbi:beta-1,6-N-acetylglucosaminyltransferase, partial [Klebsiella pneumoniae]